MWGRAIGLGLCLVAVGCGAKKPPTPPAGAEGSPGSPNEEATRWEGAGPVEKPAAAGEVALPEGPPPQRTDQYDREATEMVLRRAARQVKENCGATKDENGKAVGPWGKATVTVQLGRNGHSKGVTVPEPFEGKPTGRCIVQAFSNLTFPPWAGSDTPVDWEVEVVQPAAAGKK